jgi:hypothetical protein
MRCGSFVIPLSRDEPARVALSAIQNTPDCVPWQGAGSSTLLFAPKQSLLDAFSRNAEVAFRPEHDDNGGCEHSAACYRYHYFTSLLLLIAILDVCIGDHCDGKAPVSYCGLLLYRFYLFLLLLHMPLFLLLLLLMLMQLRHLRKKIRP